MPEIIFDAKIKEKYGYDESDPEYKEIISRKRNRTAPTFVRKRRKFSEEEIEEMRKLYDHVIVADYNDEFHMSEKDRKKKFRYYDAFSQIKVRKRKYRNLEEFVKVFRLCIDVLNLVAQDNGVYDPDKFIQMVIKGDISVVGLNFPKYVGKDRKYINWKYVTEFILNKDRDLKELSSNEDSELDDMPISSAKELVFSKEELEELEHIDDKGISNADEYDKLLIDESSKKKTEKLIKEHPGILRVMKEINRAKARNRDLSSLERSYVFDMTEDDFEAIRREDEKRGWTSDDDIPTFKGNLLNDEDYEDYMNELDEYELYHTKVNYKGKTRTLYEVCELELKDTLEKDGWNLRKLYNYKSDKKKLKKAYKQDRKREEKLKRALTELQNRKNEKSKKLGIEFDAKKKSKKNKEKKKKSKESD